VVQLGVDRTTDWLEDQASGVKVLGEGKRWKGAGGGRGVKEGFVNRS